MDIKVVGSGSKGNAYLISDGQSSLLLDAGLPYRQLQIASNFNLSNVTGVMITHCHMDHSKGVKELVRRGIDCYVSLGTKMVLNVDGHRIKVVSSMVQVRIGSFIVLPFDVRHDAPEPLGFLLESCVTGEKLLYFTDTYYLPYKFKGLTHIMGECNYCIDNILKSVDMGYIPIDLVPRLVKSHMSLEHFLEMLKANDLSKVKQVYLLHLSDNNSDADRFKLEVQKVTGAEVYVC